MIHSLAGGKIGDVSYNTFAKVKIIEEPHKDCLAWYISNIPLLVEGDQVLVPYGDKSALYKAEVVRVDKNVSSQTSPVSVRRAKEVYCKI